jgi:O-antigen/teichoic acid export membrane protein
LQVFKQWPIYFVGRVFPAVISFGGIALYTRLLDPASFGTYALCLSTAFFVGMTGFSWLRVAALRMMASVQETEEADYAATMGVSFVATAVLVAGALILGLRLGYGQLSWSSVLLTAACAVASGWFELNVTVVQARLKLISYGVLQAARATTALLATLLLIHLGFKTNALLAGFALGNCAAFGALAIWQPALRGAFSKTIFKRLFRFGWPSSGAALASFSGTFQRYALESTAGGAAVGIFAAASDFAQQTVGLLIGTATLAGQPLAFRARDLSTHDDLSGQLRNNARLVFGVGLASAAGLIVLAGPISHIYFGPKFRMDAGTILALSAVVMFVSGFRASYFDQAFEIALRTKPLAFLYFARNALVVLLSLWFIPHMGAVGAVLATLSTEIVAIVVSICWAARLVRMPVPFGGFAKITVATAAMVGVVELMPGRYSPLGLGAAVFAGVLAYGASLAFMHVRQVRALFGLSAPARVGTP